jgi:3' terminal RNA ribose 2'-O-methyltransferase Hen1
MLLTITNTQSPATDLGYLLHKNPARVHEFQVPFGNGCVFYPEADENRCTAALLVEVDRVGLIRKPRGESQSASLSNYVYDRPYSASSFLSVALGRAFGTAMAGRSKDRPELVETELPLEVVLPVLPCRGGEELIRCLFEPLDYTVAIKGHPLDDTVEEWGASPYYTVRLSNKVSIKDLLIHLYVLVPALDNKKHYWIGRDEVEKLLRKGEAWLPGHPERELISKRYLKYRRHLVDDALARLLAEETSDLEEDEEKKAGEEQSLEKPLSLNEQRYEKVMDTLLAKGARSVIDLGCGEGKFLKKLFRESVFDKVAGMDVAMRSLEIASRRLRLDALSEHQKKRIALFQGSLLYRDTRLSGFDAACAVEVIEHLDSPRLAAFERNVFEFAGPGVVIVTTPNIEYNVRFESMAHGTLRHRDHRFEWTRTEFQVWADKVAGRFGYAYEWAPIGPEDAEVGPPTQMAIFTKKAE